MKRLHVCLFGMALFAVGAIFQASVAQPVQQPFGNVEGPASNTIAEMAAQGDSLWIGPRLMVYVPEEGRFSVPAAPAVRQTFEADDNAVSSLAIGNRTAAPDVVGVGLGFRAGEESLGAAGYLISRDGGQSFEETGTHLDESSDTTVTYGVSTLRATAVTQAGGSVPRDLTFGRHADTLWVAGGLSGLRRSVDHGQSWSRVVLPPDTSTRINPSTSYDFPVGPPGEGRQGFRNHVAYSVLVDETGTLWAGTAMGINRSRPVDVGPNGDRAWRLYPGVDPVSGVPAPNVVALAEQPLPDGRNPIWFATSPARTQDQLVGRSGAAVTVDGGETFQSVLIGVQVNDLAARADRVYAAAQSGLYVTDNQGQSWRSIEDVRLDSDDEVMPGGISALSVETTPSALWVGTTEGLLRLDRSDEPRLLPDDPSAPPPSWELYRTEIPVSPDEPTDRVPDTETYAYPNPFAPSRNEVVRIVYDVPESQTVEVNIYDYSMNRVRTLREQESAGRQEMVWRGTDEGGLRLPTGTYLYTVDLGSRTVRGKIVLSN